MEKESIDLKVMWHIDALMHIFAVTIVTSVNQEGKINAAPYSLVLPFCSSPKNPQILLIVNKNWHTAKNIEATREFVLNYPKADQLSDIVKTSRFYDSETNELDYTQYTTIPSKTVRPPRIAECYQHIECRVNKIVKPSQAQINFIADVLDVSLDKELYKIPRADRIKKANPPIYLGADEHMHHIFGKLINISPVAIDLKVDK